MDPWKISKTTTYDFINQSVCLNDSVFRDSFLKEFRNDL